MRKIDEINASVDKALGLIEILREKICPDEISSVGLQEALGAEEPKPFDWLDRAKANDWGTKVTDESKAAREKIDDCPHCGNKYTDDSIVCRDCGFPNANQFTSLSIYLTAVSRAEALAVQLEKCEAALEQILGQAPSMHIGWQSVVRAMRTIAVEYFSSKTKTSQEPS